MSLLRYDKPLYLVFCNTYYPVICTSKEVANSCLDVLQNNFIKMYSSMGEVSFKYSKYVDTNLGVSGLELLVYINNNLIDAERKLFLGFLCFKHGFNEIHGSKFQEYMKSGDEWSKYRMLFDDEDLVKAFKTNRRFKELKSGKLSDEKYIAEIDGSCVVVKSAGISGDFRVDLNSNAVWGSLGKDPNIIGLDYSFGLTNRFLLRDINGNSAVLNVQGLYIYEPRFDGNSKSDFVRAELLSPATHVILYSKNGENGILSVGDLYRMVCNNIHIPGVSITLKSRHLFIQTTNGERDVFVGN